MAAAQREFPECRSHCAFCFKLNQYCCYMIENSAMNAEAMFDAACMHQLGRMEPPAFFSFTQPITKAVTAVKISTTIAPVQILKWASCLRLFTSIRHLI